MNDSNAFITIHLNGAPRRVEAGTTCQSLLDGVEGTERRLALEVNEQIVPRSRWPETRLQEGDRVEVVHAIGGGRSRTRQDPTP